MVAHPQSPGVPRLREDLRLQAAGANPDGSPAWTLHDPVRNRFFRIGWLEYEMLARWSAGDPAAIARAVRAETALAPDAAHVEAFLRFLTTHQLLEVRAPQQMDYLRRVLDLGSLSWIKWLLHHYLFFRVPLLHPEGFLDWLLPHVRVVFGRRFWAGVFLTGLVGLILANQQWDAYTATFLYFFNWQGLLCYGVALFIAKCIHELGHALTARHFGVRVPVMGIGFLVMMPVMYTDTDETWKLGDRHARLAIAAGGVLAETCLAAVCTVLWSLTADGPARSMLFFLGSASWFMTLAVNLNPLMRFDGYYLFADWLDIPNLLERSFALTRWALRRFMLGFTDPAPEALPRFRRAVMMGYGVAVCIYRFFLFLGIALVVYHKFFKLLGLFLMLVEIHWFVLRPIWNELRVWAERRAEIRYPRLAASLAVTAFVFLMMPWSHRATLPAITRDSAQMQLYPAAPARIAQIALPQGGPVRKGQLLYVLESPALAAQLRQAQLRVEDLSAAVNRSMLQAQTLEQVNVLKDERDAALTDVRGIEQQIAALDIRAPFSGVLRDVPVDLQPGNWVSSATQLGVVIQPAHPVVDAWLQENDLRDVRVGEDARFYPGRLDASPAGMKVVAIDTTSTNALPSPMLASTHGGDIPVRAGDNGELVPQQALYRITLAPIGPVQWPSQVMRGKLEISIGHDNTLAAWFADAVGRLIRESGF